MAGEPPSSFILTPSALRPGLPPACCWFVKSRSLDLGSMGAQWLLELRLPARHPSHLSEWREELPNRVLPRALRRQVAHVQRANRLRTLLQAPRLGPCHRQLAPLGGGMQRSAPGSRAHEHHRRWGAEGRRVGTRGLGPAGHVLTPTCRRKLGRTSFLRAASAACAL